MNEEATVKECQSFGYQIVMDFHKRGVELEKCEWYRDAFNYIMDKGLLELGESVKAHYREVFEKAIDKKQCTIDTGYELTKYYLKNI